MSNIKQYQLADTALDNIPVESPENVDFSKYKKENMATTWLFVKNNTAKWLSQLNVDKNIYGGFIAEPYKLFLSNAKELSKKTTEIQRTFDIKIQDQCLANNFKLNVIEQNTFDAYLLSKISCVTFLIMSMESFINNTIPDNFTINDMKKIDIEKKYSIKNKLKEIIPKIKQIDNITQYQNKYSHILELNTLRNNFIHLKTASVEKKFDPYITDIEKLLLLNIEVEYLKVEEFIEMINQYKTK